MGDYIGVIKRDTRSLDNSSCCKCLGLCPGYARNQNQTELKSHRKFGGNSDWAATVKNDVNLPPNHSCRPNKGLAIVGLEAQLYLGCKYPRSK